MKKAFILAAAFVGTAFTANAVVIFTDVWSTWTDTYQSVADYNDGNGFVKSDVGSDGGTVLSLVNGNPFAVRPNPVPPGGVYQGHAFLDTSFYMSRSLPTLTFTNNNEWAGVSQLTLSFIYGVTDNSAAQATLNFGGTSLLVSGTQVINNPDATGRATDTFKITYVWDFVVPVDLNGFTINFNVLGERIGFENFTLSATAVPEPSTYALILGGLGLAGVVIARRRRA